MTTLRAPLDEPILVGDVVSFLARVLKVGRTSITMHVAVETERSGHSIKLTEAEVTYVAVAIDGSIREPVPIRDVHDST